MNDRAEECDPPLLAATSAQARPRLQLAEILGPIAGTMIASAAAELGLTVSCQPGLGSDEIITVLSNQSLTLLTPLVCGHCVVCMMTRWPGAPPSLSGVARRLQAACCLHPVAPLSPGLQCPQVPVPTQPMAAAHCWPPQDAPLYCTVQHCTALHCTVP